MTATPRDVVDFWIGQPARDMGTMVGKAKRWFMGGPIDDEIRQKFGALVEDALAGKLDGWAKDPEGRLALIILIDQFPRNMWRDSARCYEGDPKALKLALEAADQGLDKSFDPEARMFYTLMPFMHAEDLAVQKRARAIAQELPQQADPSVQPFFFVPGQIAECYYETIEKFGRFPHRNPLLGRTTTPEEEAYLPIFWEKSVPAAMRG